MSISFSSKRTGYFVIYYKLFTQMYEIILFKFVLAETEKGSENWCLGLIFSELTLEFFGKSNEKLYPTPSYLKSFNPTRSGSLGGPITEELEASRVPSVKSGPVVLQLRKLGKLFLGPSYIYWSCFGDHGDQLLMSGFFLLGWQILASFSILLLWFKSKGVIRNKLKDSFYNVKYNCTNKNIGIMLMSVKI